MPPMRISRPQARMKMPSAAVVLPLPCPVLTITSPFFTVCRRLLIFSLRRIFGTSAQLVKYPLFDGFATAQMLLDDPNQARLIYVVVPHAVGIDGQDRPTCAHAQARRNSAFHPLWVVIAAQISKQVRQLFIQFIS